MNNYYGQQYAESEFQLGTQNEQGTRRMSGVEMSGFDSAAMFDNSIMAQNMAQGGGMTDGSSGLGQDMMEFNGASQARGSLDDFQFLPSNVDTGLMMPPGSIFRNSVAANAAAAMLAGQHATTQSMNLSSHYYSDPSQYTNFVPSGGSYGSSLSQDPQMNMNFGELAPASMTSPIDFRDSGMLATLNNGGDNFGMGQQDPSLMMHLSQSQSYFQPSSRNILEMSRDSGGGTRAEQERKSSGRSDGTMASRHNSQASIEARLGQANSRRQSLSTPAQNNQAYSSALQSTREEKEVSVQQQENLQQRQLQQRKEQNQQPQSQPRHHQQSRQPSDASVVNQMQSQSQQQDWTRTNSQSQDFPQRPMTLTLPQGVNYANAYSSTGFDMMTLLMRVATRKNPVINIGAVDLSCAFVVCDAHEHDFPIVYCSESFERLTGYTKHEILGRNCRFLQAPDGKVVPGIKRSYVDDDSILYLKNMVTSRTEAQISLINYRKGGQPFMNLLTMIPLAYDEPEIRYFVGFQVDLVEQPNSIMNKNPGGSYAINYQRGLSMPRYIHHANEQSFIEAGQILSRDDVSTALSTIGTGESELSKRLLSKVLLENTDDVVFVLSLKGLFLYLSPSCQKVLEYDSNELSGTALSSICHPSDIVPVTRELKETSSSTTVDIVFRIRRKQSGYMWFEGSGSLHTEQGKGRKSVVLVGRQRPVYTLNKLDIQESGGIGDNEVWAKLSASGLFLFNSANVRQLLDKQPEELIGTSMQSLMRPESRQEFSRVLEIARSGRIASCKHELLNKRGQVLQAYSTIYPGDASEGQKPTFIIAQTRLLKYSRSSTNNQRPTALTTTEYSSSESTKQLGSDVSATSLMPATTIIQHLANGESVPTSAGHWGFEIGRQDFALAADENMFDELKTTRSTSWQFELRQMEKRNRLLAEELQGLLAARKKRKRRKGAGNVEKDCANCHTRATPEWRRGPSGNRDLCNSCGLRWAKQQGRISPRTTTSQRSVHSHSSQTGNASPKHASSAAIKAKNQASIEGTLAQTGMSMPPQASGAEMGDGHVSKAAKFDADATPRRQSMSFNVPTKIEEGEEDEEPDDEEMD